MVQFNHRARRTCVRALFATVSTCLTLSAGATAQTDAAAPAPATTTAGAEYRDYDAFTASVNELAATFGDRVKMRSLARTIGGRDVWALQVAAPGNRPPDQRPAILLVGGIDAECPAAAELALSVVRELLDDARADDGSEAAKLLERYTLLVIPRANPDGVEAFFRTPGHAARVNARRIDEDRDGVVDEDGPNDLNGDGLITVMRVAHPDGEWLPDPDEPRLLRKADAGKGEDGLYAVMFEGEDDDGDGQMGEDPPGGVDDDRNWPHFYEPGVARHGPHQISERTTRAIADYVVGNRRIAAAIVYGRHDNLVQVPKGQERGPIGRAYRDLHPDDVALYEHVSRKYKEITGLTGSFGSSPPGALYAWLYAQQGIPTFATRAWWPLGGADEETAGDGEGEGEGEDGDQDDGGEEASEDEGESGQTARGRPARGEGRRGRGPGRRGPRGGGGGASGSAEWLAKPLEARFESGDTARAWLKYSDEQRDGAGFVAWSAFEHPTLGAVEIGGFTPWFFTAPPESELAGIAAREAQFVTALNDLMPAIGFAPRKVRHLGGDVWEVQLLLHNDGYLPTHTGIARHVERAPIVVRTDFDPERLIGGRPMERVRNLPGAGGSEELRWLVRGRQGDVLRFVASNPTYGEIPLDLRLEEVSDKATATQEAAE